MSRVSVHKSCNHCDFVAFSGTLSVGARFVYWVLRWGWWKCHGEWCVCPRKPSIKIRWLYGSSITAFKALPRLLGAPFSGVLDMSSTFSISSFNNSFLVITNLIILQFLRAFATEHVQIMYKMAPARCEAAVLALPRWRKSSMKWPGSSNQSIHSAVCLQIRLVGYYR